MGVGLTCTAHRGRCICYSPARHTGVAAFVGTFAVHTAPFTQPVARGALVGAEVGAGVAADEGAVTRAQAAHVHPPVQACRAVALTHMAALHDLQARTAMNKSAFCAKLLLCCTTLYIEIK